VTHIAVLVEHTSGDVRQSTLEALTLARSLGDPVGIWIGEEPSSDACHELGRYGASEVRHVPAPDQSTYTAELMAQAVIAAMGEASVLLAISTFATKEVLAYVAHRTGAGIVVDAASAAWDEGKIVTTQTVFSATWNVRTAIQTPLAIVAVRPNTTQAQASPEPAGAALVPVECEFTQPHTTVLSRTSVKQQGIPLAEAPIVVSGGRGTEGDFSLVEQLAQVLGGAVGATRDATDEGWIAHEHMVGQTGTTVTPALYVACGLSGAVHHRGGMQASGTIVAINTDPDAPIFEIADFGVVGDLREVIPATIAHLQGR